MILSANSTPYAGYYTFLIRASDGGDPQPYRVTAKTYMTVNPRGKAPWNVIAYNGEKSDEISQRWTVETPDALLTTAIDVAAFA